MKMLLALAVASQFTVFNTSLSSDKLFSELADEMSTLKSAQNNKNTLSDEFTRFKQQHIKEYNSYVEEHLAAFDEYRDSLLKHWGEAAVSDKSQFVSYNANNNSRLIANFENQTLELSLLHNADEPISSERLKSEVSSFFKKEAAVFEHFEDSLDLDFFLNNVKFKEEVHVSQTKKVSAVLAAKSQIKKQTLQQAQLLDAQFDAKLAFSQDPQEQNKHKLELENKKQKLQTLQNKRIRKLARTVKSIPKAEENKSIKKYIVELPKKNTLQKRANLYKELVLNNSKYFDVPVSLIYSVMHTESHFNPMAKSHIPAYGLMQVVPTSAGVDVNRLLYDIDRPMSAPYLYVEKNNIEAGAAYLHLLEKRYLKLILDPLSRKYCAIAAYNTGAGNVAKAFNNDGSRNIVKASKVINSLSPENVLETLLANLPYNETKNYLRKVLKIEKHYVMKKI